MSNGQSKTAPSLSQHRESYLVEAGINGVLTTLLGIVLMTLLPLLAWLGFIALVKFLWQHSRL